MLYLYGRKGRLIVLQFSDPVKGEFLSWLLNSAFNSSIYWRASLSQVLGKILNDWFTWSMVIILSWNYWGLEVAKVSVNMILMRWGEFHQIHEKPITRTFHFSNSYMYSGFWCIEMGKKMKEQELIAWLTPLRSTVFQTGRFCGVPFFFCYSFIYLVDGGIDCYSFTCPTKICRAFRCLKWPMIITTIQSRFEDRNPLNWGEI